MDFISQNIINIIFLLPILTLVLGAFLMFLLDTFNLKGLRDILCILSIIASSIFTFAKVSHNEIIFKGFFRVDSFSVFFDEIILFALLFSILLNKGKLEPQGIKKSVDVNILLMFSSVGAIIMVAASNFLALFIGLEIMSLSLYALSASSRKEKSSSEGAIKYFIMGALASAFLLYGISFLYGASGSFSYYEMSSSLGTRLTFLLIGFPLFILGFSFKIGLVPFHFWKPDVYEGVPCGIVSFMAVVVKVASFSVLLKIMILLFSSFSFLWMDVFLFLALASMTLGNLVALYQRSIKRMLAYSSIAHAGYILVGFLGLSSGSLSSNFSLGASSSVFYLLAYGVMTMGAFSVSLVVLTSSKTSKLYKDDLKSFSNLGWSEPLLGLSMVVFMLSLAGIPPFCGFMGKLYLFISGISAGFTYVSVVLAINSVISLYYYLRVIGYMYFVKQKVDNSFLDVDNSYQKGVILVLAILTLFLGLNSSYFISIAKEAVLSL